MDHPTDEPQTRPRVARESKPRPPTRDIIRWDDNYYRRLLVIIHHISSRDDVFLPWQHVANLMGDGLTPGAIKQHMDKLRKSAARFWAVPAPPKRGGNRRPRPGSKEEKDRDHAKLIEEVTKHDRRTMWEVAKEEGLHYEALPKSVQSWRRQVSEAPDDMQTMDNIEAEPDMPSGEDWVPPALPPSPPPAPERRRVEESLARKALTGDNGQLKRGRPLENYPTPSRSPSCNTVKRQRQQSPPRHAQQTLTVTSAPQAIPHAASQAAPRTAPQTAPSNGTRAAALVEPQAALRAAPQTAPPAAPPAALQAAPRAAPQASYQAAPQTTFQAAPQAAFQANSQAAFQAAPEPTFQATFQTAVQAAPQAAFQAAPQAAAQNAPRAASRTSIPEILNPTAGSRTVSGSFTDSGYGTTSTGRPSVASMLHLPPVTTYLDLQLNDVAAPVATHGQASHHSAASIPGIGAKHEPRFDAQLQNQHWQYDALIPPQDLNEASSAQNLSTDPANMMGYGGYDPNIPYPSYLDNNNYYAHDYQANWQDLPGAPDTSLPLDINPYGQILDDDLFTELADDMTPAETIDPSILMNDATPPHLEPTIFDTSPSSTRPDSPYTTFPGGPIFWNMPRQLCNDESPLQSPLGTMLGIRTQTAA